MGNSPLIFLGVFFIAAGAAKVVYALILKNKEERNQPDDQAEGTS